MAIRGGNDLARLAPRPVLAAVMTAAFTALYTVIDGIGVRTSANALGYIAWVHVVIGLFVLTAVAATRGPAMVKLMATSWRAGLAGGLMALLAYGIALWAMTRAPVTMVAALRETSVLFVALFSVVFLKEQLTGWRVLAMAMIIGGVVLLRMA